jgi:hypothetical protein
VTTRIVEGIDGASTATGIVVVIDVLRTFTTAAHAFDAGIDEIELGLKRLSRRSPHQGFGWVRSAGD